MRRTPSTAPDLPGYDVVRLLGSGGFSDVFLYDQRLPKRQVAVKVLLIEGLGDSTRAQFVAEANVMAQLSAHPYIVTIHHADVAADARPYFVMEYCSGPSLAERYKRERFSVEDALRTGVRLSSAVATAHSVGILHRDIKPGNVLTNAFGWPALTDFGISSTLEEELPLHTTTGGRPSAHDETASGTGSGQSVGMSVPWSPPEMFVDNPQPDVRSDVFSLAATIHTLLAGRTPFEVPGRSNGTLDLIGRIERGVITPLGRDDVPRSLTAVLQKGMAARRADRFSTAVEFARALQRVELELGYAPTSIEVPNLVVAAAEREAQDDDATRARSVSTIAVQPPPAAPTTAPPAAASPTTAPPAPPAESTRLRAPVSVEQTVVRPRRETVHEPADEQQAGGVGASAIDATGTPDEPRRRRVLPFVLGAAALLVAAGVVAAVLTSLGGGTNDAGPTTAPAAGAGIDVSAVPTPKLVSVTPSADGTSAAFAWSNPKPKGGDTFLWAPSETPNKVTHVDDPNLTVSGVTPGSRVCIDVWVLRDGRTSAEPLQACTP
ncbi:serine/threonine-protein kinase [Microbacterium sp. STN6]|uniref:serine/threonine-protein kinase n=1 Tax=Microbacterium sp. STN6 TaxID=2995588 RepID=UPI002260C705|nr:serine/threonine-protein kinase [Microbacterium sp. STN6]MCX7522079.1 serine/threonine-protein kinase [Microbacterium sp. STN6]